MPCAWHTPQQETASQINISSALGSAQWSYQCWCLCIYVDLQIIAVEGWWLTGAFMGFAGGCQGPKEELEVSAEVLAQGRVLPGRG